jgi:Zn-finger nucleic acid-binding protein
MTGLEWQCPHCDTVLVKDQQDGIEVDICPRCGGIWFDGGELSRLAQSRPGALAGLEHRNNPSEAAATRGTPMGGRLCPPCRVYLTEFEYSWAPGIRLDGCPKCKGIWADDGELSRIEALVARYRRGAAGGFAPAAEPHGVAQRVHAVRTLISRPAEGS